MKKKLIFLATLEFQSPYHAGDQDFMRRGALILQKSNPSGLPEHDPENDFADDASNALEIPIFFSSP